MSAPIEDKTWCPQIKTGGNFYKRNKEKYKLIKWRESPGSNTGDMEEVGLQQQEDLPPKKTDVQP